MPRKLTQHEIDEMRALKRSGLSCTQIGLKMGINYLTVKSRCRGITEFAQPFTEDEAKEMIRLREQKVKFKDIALQFNTSIGRVQHTIKKNELQNEFFTWDSPAFIY